MTSFIRTPAGRFTALVAALMLVNAAVAAQGTNTTRVPVKPDSAKAAPMPGAAMPGADTSGMITTLSRVITADQASKGRQVYLLVCVSCHSPSDHTGGAFWRDLVGKTVGEFFSYVRNNMPEDDVGSITEDDYVNVTAYMLALNAAPLGNVPLPRDSTLQAKIRIVPFDSTKVPPLDTIVAGSSKRGFDTLNSGAETLEFHPHTPKARHVPRHTIR